MSNVLSVVNPTGATSAYVNAGNVADPPLLNAFKGGPWNSGAYMHADDAARFDTGTAAYADTYVVTDTTH